MRAPAPAERNRPLTVDHLNQLLLVSAVVLLVAVAAVRLSSRSGLPSLLVYLGIGVVMGTDGLGNVSFDDVRLTQVIGYAALVVILTEGGLGTKWKEVRPALPAAAALSTVGVGISVGITALGAHYVVGLDWRAALIIGAVVSSTDAAAVFSVLRKVPLPSRITGTLEAESGFNDAPVVILVVAFSTAGPVEHWYVLLGEIALELAIGAAVGLAVGWLGAYGLRHVALPASGLYPIAVMAIAVTAYASGALAHGSGFLAVYLASMVLGNAKLPHWPATRGFAEGLGWLAQIGMFVLLGLLVTPHELASDMVPALLIGLILTALARPASVLLSLLPFRLPWREQALMSWAGLRGAVPIILATIPMVGGIKDSQHIFNIVFVLVVVYTLVQGPTLPWLARRLGLGNRAETADLGVESAPLERLRGHLLSVAVPGDSRMHGVEVSELRLPKGSAVTLVVREGTSFVPTPTTTLRRGDELLVVATDPVREAAEDRLRAVAHGGKLAGWLGHEDDAGPASGAVAGAGRMGAGSGAGAGRAGSGAGRSGARAGSGRSGTGAGRSGAGAGAGRSGAGGGAGRPGAGAGRAGAGAGRGAVGKGLVGAGTERAGTGAGRADTGAGTGAGTGRADAAGRGAAVGKQEAGQAGGRSLGRLRFSRSSDVSGRGANGKVRPEYGEPGAAGEGGTGAGASGAGASGAGAASGARTGGTDTDRAGARGQGAGRFGADRAGAASASAGGQGAGSTGARSSVAGGQDVDSAAGTGASDGRGDAFVPEEREAPAAERRGTGSVPPLPPAPSVCEKARGQAARSAAAGKPTPEDLRPAEDRQAEGAGVDEPDGERDPA
ncbi:MULTISPECIES: potassium/proton antiporter [unclassified Streptomyces]|uniref:potassium/proton antiporter n=1 Tax=unclassified Streptomyces TaxID=2593676 RepID=UPI00081D84D2|nr:MULTISPECIES: potassium/proton antiporter [unclassified Streptomyces]MYR28206.1 potassium/proton antiporter [Streptomyces sp. SID4945]SCF35269.1 NhaP-type Na+/H+ and K+/H+ antiporter with C-terminal TrkAC and CorC domains [Streptomyces sp. LcepLS]